MEQPPPAPAPPPPAAQPEATAAADAAPAAASPPAAAPPLPVSRGPPSALAEGQQEGVVAASKFSQQLIEQKERELQATIVSSFNHVVDVQRQLRELQLQVKLTAEPKKQALELLRKKIEVQGAKVASIRRRYDAAKQAFEEVAAELAHEDEVKQQLCNELQLLVSNSVNVQLERFEQIKAQLEAMQGGGGAAAAAAAVGRSSSAPTSLGPPPGPAAGGAASAAGCNGGAAPAAPGDAPPATAAAAGSSSCGAGGQPAQPDEAAAAAAAAVAAAQEAAARQAAAAAARRAAEAEAAAAARSRHVALPGRAPRHGRAPAAAQQQQRQQQAEHSGAAVERDGRFAGFDA